MEKGFFDNCTVADDVELNHLLSSKNAAGCGVFPLRNIGYDMYGKNKSLSGLKVIQYQPCLLFQLFSGTNRVAWYHQLFVLF
jgi:hypothetical protein